MATTTNVDVGHHDNEDGDGGDRRNWGASEFEENEFDYDENDLSYLDNNGGGNDSDDESDDDLDIDPNHPALQRVQIALQRQLTARKLKAENDLKIKKA